MSRVLIEFLISVHGGMRMSGFQEPVVSTQVLLITQRCYERQFLLNGESDRRRWLYWLYQARRIHKLSVLNYVVTSNHIHLLIQDPGPQRLANVMQMINSRLQSEYNRRQRRRQTLWDTQYQVTAVQTNTHLWRCMNYIDMNMVRAGEVRHPRMWRCSGYFESLSPLRRAGRLDHAAVVRILRFDNKAVLQKARDTWIEQKLESADLSREAYWSDSLPVGDLPFALKMKRALAFAYPAGTAQRESGCFAVR